MNNVISDYLVMGGEGHLCHTDTFFIVSAAYIQMHSRMFLSHRQGSGDIAISLAPVCLSVHMNGPLLGS